MRASGNAALIPLFIIISPGEKPPLCWRSGRGSHHLPPVPLPAPAHIPAPASAPAAPGPLLFLHPGRRRGRRQAFQSASSPGAESHARWLQWRPGLWPVPAPLLLMAGGHLQVSIVENDCIGDILCFPVVRLFFQQFDRCQMDRVADIEPQGKTPSFFLGRHSCHLPAASRRYRYSYPAALALILETNNGLPTFPDASICRRNRMAPPPTKTTVQ